MEPAARWLEDAFQEVVDSRAEYTRILESSGAEYYLNIGEAAARVDAASERYGFSPIYDPIFAIKRTGCDETWRC